MAVESLGGNVGAWRRESPSGACRGLEGFGLCGIAFVPGDDDGEGLLASNGAFVQWHEVLVQDGLVATYAPIWLRNRYSRLPRVGSEDEFWENHLPAIATY